MRIVVVTQYFWPENFRINELVAQMVGRGHEVEVLTGIPNYPGGKFFDGYGYFRNRRQTYRGARVLRVPLLPRGSGRGWRLALNYLSFAVFACLWAPFLVRGRPDAIFVFEPSPVTVGLPAILLRALRGTPVYFWVQDLWPESLVATGAVRSRAVLSAVRRLVRFIYRRCDWILVQSRAFAENIRGFGVPESRILYFPNSAEQVYRPFERSETLPIAARIPRGFNLMFAGNIGAAQDFDTILATAERLRGIEDLNWVILGDGRLKAWVEAEVGRRGLEGKVHLLGFYPVEDMPHCFAFADAMLVTLRDEPIFSMTVPAKVQSYLACAKPTIAALRGEGARVVEEAGAGIACAPQNPEALAEAILTLYRMPAGRRRELGANGRRYFEEHFDGPMLVTRLEGWLREGCRDHA